jgi:hypothetical protein
MTTFSLRDAVKTMTSAMSSGVRGSHPLERASRVSCTDAPGGCTYKRLDLRVDGFGLGLVTVEADDGEFLYDQGECTGREKAGGTPLGRGGSHRLDLPGVDADDADARGDELLTQCVGEAADGRLGGAVDASASVRFTA